MKHPPTLAALAAPQGARQWLGLTWGRCVSAVRTGSTRAPIVTALTLKASATDRRAHDHAVGAVALGHPRRRVGAHVVADRVIRRVAMVRRALVEEAPDRLRAARARAAGLIG